MPLFLHICAQEIFIMKRWLSARLYLRLLYDFITMVYNRKNIMPDYLFPRDMC